MAASPPHRGIEQPADPWSEEQPTPKAALQIRKERDTNGVEEPDTNRVGRIIDLIAARRHRHAN
jgi:hypothetical protein